MAGEWDRVVALSRNEDLTIAEVTGRHLLPQTQVLASWVFLNCDLRRDQQASSFLVTPHTAHEGGFGVLPGSVAPLAHNGLPTAWCCRRPAEDSFTNLAQTTGP